MNMESPFHTHISTLSRCVLQHRQLLDKPETAYGRICAYKSDTLMQPDSTHEWICRISIELSCFVPGEFQEACESAQNRLTRGELLVVAEPYLQIPTITS
jgi:hypothetical protein